jgi:hypothetical protein
MCAAILDCYVLSFCSSTIQVVTDKNNEAKYFRLTEFGMEIVSACTQSGFHPHEDESGKALEGLYEEVPVTHIGKSKRGMIHVFDSETVFNTSSTATERIIDKRIIKDAQPINKKENIEAGLRNILAQSLNQPADEQAEEQLPRVALTEPVSDPLIVGGLVAAIIRLEACMESPDEINNGLDLFSDCVSQDDRVFSVFKLNKWKISSANEHLGFRGMPSIPKLVEELALVIANVKLEDPAG